MPSIPRGSLGGPLDPPGALRHILRAGPPRSGCPPSAFALRGPAHEPAEPAADERQLDSAVILARHLVGAIDLEEEDL
jgi:hypothetical protein